MSYCPNCGTQQDAQGRFCGNCGCARAAEPPHNVKLHFQREKQRFVVGVTNVEILIDNMLAATLPKEGCAVIEVQAGWHNITIRNAGAIPLALGPKQLNVCFMQDSVISIGIERLTGCIFETKVWPLT